MKSSFLAGKKKAIQTAMVVCLRKKIKIAVDKYGTLINTGEQPALKHIHWISTHYFCVIAAVYIEFPNFGDIF